MLQLAPETRRIATARLLRSLTLEPLDVDAGPPRHYRAEAASELPRLFGGLLAAGCLVAALRHLRRSDVRAERHLHSVHLYFLRPGRAGQPLDYRVEPVRDGRSFSVRRVTAFQDGRELVQAMLSLTDQRKGVTHQDPMPAGPPPEVCGDREERRIERLGPGWIEEPMNALEVRLTDSRLLDPHSALPPTQVNWARYPALDAELPQHDLGISRTDLDSALLLFASDRGLLSTAALPHGLVWGQSAGASLDHAVWQHRPCNLADWHLFCAHSPVADAGRGLIACGIYGATGRRLASVNQEALLRAAPADDRSQR